jgi:hypothetical protein
MPIFVGRLKKSSSICFIVNCVRYIWFSILESNTNETLNLTLGVSLQTTGRLENDTGARTGVGLGA